MTDNTKLIPRMNKLLSSGHAFAMLRQEDLRDLLIMVAQEQNTAAMLLNAQARNQKLTSDNHQLAKACQRKDREASAHGDERRRFMGNNRALLVENERLRRAVEDGVATRLLYLESCLDIVRRAVK